MANNKRRAKADSDAPGPSRQRTEAKKTEGDEQQEHRPAEQDRRGEMAKVARRRAAHFATWEAGGDDNTTGPSSVHAGGSAARELGPWSSAVQLVEAREREKERREEKIMEAARGTTAAAPAIWTPRRDQSLGPRSRCAVALLSQMALRLVVDLLEDVETLWGLPDVVKNLVAAEACRRRALTPGTLRLFVEHSPTEICLPDCSHIGADAMIPALLEAATPKLEKLALGMIGRGLTDAGAQELATRGVLSSLKYLRLGGAYRLSDAGVIALLQRASHLHTLELPVCSRIEGTCIEALPQLTAHLRKLDLEECRGLGASTILAAVKGLPRLEMLKLNGIPEVDDTMLRALSTESNPALTELSLGACLGVTGEGVIVLATEFPGLQRLVLDDCWKVGDAAVVSVAQKCRSLTLLSLKGCMGVSDTAVSALAELDSLHNLCLGGAVNLTDAAALALARGPSAAALQDVDFSWCRGIGPQALGLLADSCHGLRRLALWGCTQVDGSDFLLGHSNDHLVIVR